MGHIVAIVGRPNVGKSTFFNRLTQSRSAIVDKTSGVTRDRHYGFSQWNGKNFSVIDTGGYTTSKQDQFQREIDKQIALAINEADTIVFMVDVEVGVAAADLDVAKLLRKSGKPVFLVANKVDHSDRLNQITEFYSLGFEKIHGLSSINGFGTGDLLDELVNSIPENQHLNQDELPRLAIIGRPNAGKSSLLNVLIQKERSIVTEQSGTTRDSIDTIYNKFGMQFKLIDTAGIRKKSKVKEDIEFYSVLRAVKSIEQSDICFLMIDAQKGFERQDQKIFWLVHRNYKGIVLLVNKWDLIEKQNLSAEKTENQIREIIAPYDDVPILFISCLRKQRVYKALEIGMKVYQNKTKRIPTNQLNKTLIPLIENNPPPTYKGKQPKIKYTSQLPTAYPQFIFHCSRPQYINPTYTRYLENQIRKNFEFSGVPIQIFYRKK
ncbi:MAG: ribosome biogenesis GTPase Der [Flavobacteriaceae bacterium]|nr:ribosome biogenesis GTPase Der [Flavobacteriaceae bacterium]